MSFDSVIFISCFLPVLAILYAIARGKTARNVLLLAAGLIFYAFGSLSGLALLLACAAVNYGFGLLLLRTGCFQVSGFRPFRAGACPRRTADQRRPGRACRDFVFHVQMHLLHRRHLSGQTQRHAELF